MLFSVLLNENSVKINKRMWEIIIQLQRITKHHPVVNYYYVHNMLMVLSLHACRTLTLRIALSAFEVVLNSAVHASLRP